MQILDGKAVAKTRRQQIKARADRYQKAHGRAPGLAVILVGDDPASHVYVANKIRACHEVGIVSFERKIASTTAPEQLRAIIDDLNNDKKVDGILLQLPLPPQLDATQAIQWIAPAKDADCLSSENLGRLWSGRPLTTPCTPWGVMVILEHYGYSVAGKDAVVIGRSQIVGKPMAHLLSQANATVTICHSRTRDLRRYTRNAEIVVVAAGRPELLGREDFSQGAIVIDVGIHRKSTADGKTKLVGDVRASELEDWALALTPVPGGVGPMTITMLMENTLCLAEQSRA